MRLVRGKSTPAIRAMRLPLPLLVLGVGADDADDAAPPYHLALVANPPHRRSYFHHALLSDLSNDPAARQIPRRQLDHDPIPDEQPHEVAVQSTARMRRHPPAVHVH